MRVRTIRGLSVAVAGVILSAIIVTAAGASSLATGNSHAHPRQTVWVME